MAPQPQNHAALAWQIRDGFLALRWAEGGEEELFHFAWLRENSFDPATRDRKSGQKIKPFSSIPAALHPLEVVCHGDSQLSIQWDDQTVSTFPVAWLRSHGPSASSHRRQMASPRLWRGEEAAAAPVYDYKDIACDEGSVYRLLDTLTRYGFARLKGVPCRLGEVAGLAERFGYVRETNYGRVFDVLTLVDPDHPANTSIALAPHSDNNYRHSTPSVQILHCLKNSTVGGESTLVDGFAVAEAFRREQPEAFACLTRLPAAFFYEDEKTSLYHETPVIKLGYAGALSEIHFNERTLAPLSLTPEETQAFYASYRLFSAVVHEPTWQFQFKMGAGDAIIFNNIRLLHGRTAYEHTAGERHLQGCYSDIDSYDSLRRVLARRLAVGTAY